MISDIFSKIINQAQFMNLQNENLKDTKIVMPKIKIPITKARFWKSGTNENVHRLSGITQNWQFPGDSK